MSLFSGWTMSRDQAFSMAESFIRLGAPMHPKLHDKLREIIGETTEEEVARMRAARLAGEAARERSREQLRQLADATRRAPVSDFSIITPRLATGAAISSSQDVADLLTAGITAVVDCRDDFDDAPLLATAGLHYLWNGVPDDGQPKPAGWFRRSIVFALDLISHRHHCVYCHCAAGVNRGPSTAFAIMLAQGFEPLVAEQIIRAARPQVGLAYKDDAIRAVDQLGYHRTVRT